MNAFGPFLRDWRSRHRYSQLELALAAETSSRHISFLESGRANPSREMVLKLAATLNIPKVEINNGLLSAGFAPIYPQLDRDAKSLKAIHQAIDTTLANHSPFPAIAFDAQWNILQSNPAAVQLVKALEATQATNVMQIMLATDAADSPLLNWPEVARLALARLRTERLQKPDDPTLKELQQHLSQHPRIHEDCDGQKKELGVILPMRIRTPETVLSLFSMIAQFGSVQEISMSEVRIELFFPEDSATADYFSFDEK